MAEFRIGGLARSRAYHDKNELYVITSQDETYVYLSDGRCHPLEKPKRKNRKHLSPETWYDESLAMKLTQAGGARNEEIRALIRSRKQQEGI